MRSRGLAEPRATATSALECLHLCPPHRYPTPKHAASTPPNSPQAPRPYQSLDESRFIFTLVPQQLLQSFTVSRAAGSHSL